MSDLAMLLTKCGQAAAAMVFPPFPQFISLSASIA
jgi:hypothetical protein